jgi:hypothetical protein
MVNHMSRNLKILFVLAALVVMVVIVGLLAEYITRPPSQGGFPFGAQLRQVDPADLAVYFVARTIVSTINIALLLVLVITYASIFLKTRSEFTIGLLIFSIVFLMKDIAASPFVSRSFGFGLFGIQPIALWFVLLPDLFELVALSVLMYLSIKY